MQGDVLVLYSFFLFQMDTLNQLWLEDLALRLICVLALDRFGDFVSDEVGVLSILLSLYPK